MANTFQEPEEINLVQLWLRVDVSRWIAGALGGIFAALIAAGFAGIMVQAKGGEFLFPVKFLALPFMGNAATEMGMHMGAIIGGLIVLAVVSSILGVLYAHFTVGNNKAALWGGGFVWGTFSWIFINNLFIQSFKDVRAANISNGSAFFVLMIFGFSLTSVGFFDRMIRGK